jgi:Zn-dependent protease with chaperone function
MTRPNAHLLQVALTGKRLATANDAELLARLQTRFKLSQTQSAALLKGRCVVKRGIDRASAQKLVAVLAELGLEAVIEETRATVAPLDALHALADQRLPNPRVGFGYLIGLLLVTVLSVALPAIYIGLTGGIAFGWFWYLTHIHHHLPHSAHLVALMYAVPGLAGAVLVTFLIRPLFTARPRPRETLKLDPEKEAAFVSGVRALCRAIGVSPPVEIRLSWDTNASVHFRTPWLSLITGHKVLTIGLSLVGGLSARQFVGVLAHEFGHFAQRAGMFCAFAVNSINAWLEHCAYGEDAWARKMREWSEAATEKEHWFSFIVNLSVMATWLAIGLTRWLMAGLFHISFRLSRYMSRQMEFDADRYEALLAGSDAFRATARSLRALNHAFEEVNQSNIEAWQEHRLLADLPEAVAVHAREFDAARLAKIDDEMRERTTTRYWDSHPPDVERIDNAEKRRCPGIYHEEAPATLLFKDFAGWSRRATRMFYAEHGVQFKEEQLRSRDEIFGHVRHRNRQREQLDRFFNGQFQDWPLIQLRLQDAGQPGQLSWQDCINQIRARSPETARNWLQALHMRESRPLLRAAVKLGADSREMGIPGAKRSPEELGTELESIAGHRLACHRPLEQSFALYALRVEHAINSMPPAERDQASRLRKTLVELGALELEASSLDEFGGAMRVFASIAETQGEMHPGFKELESNFADCASRLLARADRISQTVTSDGTVGAYLRARCHELPPAGTTSADASTLARASWPIPNAFHHLYLLALGELVALCEAAEKGSGIRPIRLVA